MSTRIRVILCVLAAVLGGTGLRAAENAPPPMTGHVLVLTNERTLEGDIERVGDEYRIKRLLGETWVPADKALRLCADMSDAHKYLHGQANLDDPDERIRLAKWCLEHGLREQALEEVKAAVELGPNHTEAKRLLRSLQQPIPATSPSRSQPTISESEAAASTPPIDVTAKAMNQFATHIQPILMNACASCHAGNDAGAFKLVRTFDHGSLVPKTTHQNLTAVLSEINLEQPRSSPLLIKAASAHGSMTQAPLSGRQLPAYHAMEEWVKLTLANQLGTREQPVQAAADAPVKEPKPATKADKPTVGKPAAPAKVGDAPPAFSEDQTKDREPVDPFDPAIFNKQMHPDKK
jgi:hypothetical protein